ncbi:hypothetical protein LCGC14_3127940, partial [marine sediment metagenome]
VFELTTGGRVTGEWLNRNEPSRKAYIVQTASGARVTLAKSQVKRFFHVRPIEEEYAKIRPSYPDTVEGQWAIAQWCRENRLSRQRKTHLQRIIELDPDHVAARGALGYKSINGQWSTQEEAMLRQGYRRYEGRWRTSQEIELIEKKRKVDVAQKQWAVKIKRWRGWLGTDRDADGRRSILGIEDPQAVVALIRFLESEPVEHVRLLYVEALARVGTPDAVKALAIRSMTDKAEEVRLTCLDYLEKTDDPEPIDYYVGMLRHAENHMVNKAAVALKRMRDPSSVGPLIEALVTTHKFKITTGNPGSMTTTFGTGPGGSGAPGGSGLSTGGGTRIVHQRFPN